MFFGGFSKFNFALYTLLYKNLIKCCESLSFFFCFFLAGGGGGDVFFDYS